MNSIRHELSLAWGMIRKYYAEILCVCLAATLLALLHGHSRLIPHFGRGLDALLYWGVVPLVFGMIVCRKNPFQLGVGPGNYKFWVPASLAWLAVALPILYLSNHLDSNVNAYYTRRSFDLWPTLQFYMVFCLGWDYLMRGFLIFSLKDRMKEGAILVGLIPAVLLHLGKADAEVFSTAIVHLTWGYICYRGNSFWPSYLMHLVVQPFIYLVAQGMI